MIGDAWQGGGAQEGKHAESPCRHKFLMYPQHSSPKKFLYIHACPLVHLPCYVMKAKEKKSLCKDSVSLNKTPKNQEEFLLLHSSRRKATVSKYRSTPWKSECSKGFTFSKSSLESSVVNRWETALVCGTSTCSSPSQCQDGAGPS